MRSSVKNLTLATIASGCLPAPLLAHPGAHEGGAAGLIHAVTEPDHLLALLAIGAAAMWAFWLFRYAGIILRRRRRVAKS